MNLRNIAKIMIIIFLIQMFVLPTTAQASIWTDIFSWASNFEEEGRNTTLMLDNGDGSTTAVDISVNTATLKETSDIIFNAFFAIGVALTLIVGGVLGVQFMIASAEDKAKVKESMIPYVYGCIVIYGAFGIWKLVLEIVQTI